LGVYIIITSGTSKNILGRVVLIAPEFANKKGTLVRPILDGSFKVIGTITLQYLVISPFSHEKNTFNPKALEANWNSQINMIGHRGLGTNRRSYIRENTILSFNIANTKGINYVEFDVHLTSDNVPVIYHDFFITLKGTEVSMANLNLKEFKKALSMHMPEINDLSSSKRTPLNRSKSEMDVKNTENDSRWLITDPDFPTLQELFEKVSSNVGFNVEIKYPHDAIFSKANYLERNSYLDYILEVVFSHAGNRPLYFSSFDPEICILLSRKQGKYPVFFLTEGKAGGRRYDPRCNSLSSALQFADQLGLAGIVSDSKPVLKDLNIIKEIHNRKLLLFTWGSLNNVPQSVLQQKLNGVDAIISDKIPYVRQN